MHLELPPDPRARRGLAAVVRALTVTLLRRIWLPPRLYDAVPWIYLGAGSAALAGGLYLPEDAWYLPYLALAGLGLLRIAVAVATLRRRWQLRRRPGRPA